MELQAAQQWSDDCRVPGNQRMHKVKESRIFILQIPDYPKVGFWTIRAAAQGQVYDKKVIPNKLYRLTLDFGDCSTGTV